MSPMEKRRVVFFSVAVLSVVFLGLAIYFIPNFTYLLFIISVCCVACGYNPADDSTYERGGRHPGPRVAVPLLLRRWLPARTSDRAPSGGRFGSRGIAARSVKGPLRDNAQANGARRPGDSANFFQETEEFGGSLLLSPRDTVLGCCAGNRDGSAGPWRWGTVGNRELRERAVRPIHAAASTRRALSFRDPWGSGSRLVITPQRNYPLQSTCSPPLGVLLAPAPWSTCQKNILMPQGSPMAHSPVTVKIARPDHSSIRSPVQLSSPRTPLSPRLGPAPDPCSREVVLNVLRESRKSGLREPEDDSSAAPQNSKRRRHDSGGSGSSAFEPLMANGMPSQLVPRPGRMKRGINMSAMEDSPMKRSRTSPTGSGTASGGDSSTRNPIHSSYSSTQGPAQTKSSSLCVTPLSSPESSRSQTPERPPKKAREKEVISPSCQSTLKSDRIVTSQGGTAGRNTPTSRTPVLLPPVCNSGHSEVTRKRKIQLVSSQRGDHISLPPPPQLGYTVTTTDLDSDKKATLNRLNSTLEEPKTAKPTPMPDLATPITPQDSVSNAAPPVFETLLLGSTGTTGPTLPLVLPIAALLPGTPSCTLASTHSCCVSSSTSTGSTVYTAPILADPLKDSPSQPPGVSVPLTVSFSMCLLGSRCLPVSIGPAVVQGGVSGAPVSPAASTASATSAPALGSSSPTSQHSLPMATLMSPSRMVFLPTSTQVLPLVSAAITSGVVGSVKAPGPLFLSSMSNTTFATNTVNSTSVVPLFKPIFGTVSTAPTVTGSSQEVATFKAPFGITTATNGFRQPLAASGVPPMASSSGSSSVFSTTAPATLAKTLSANRVPATSFSVDASFKFGATDATTFVPSLSSAGASISTTTPFQFDASLSTTFHQTTSNTVPKPPLQAPSQSVFSFGKTAAGSSLGGFGMAVTTPSSTTATPASICQATFTLGKCSVNGPVSVPSTLQTPTVKPFTLGMFNGGGDGGGAPSNSSTLDSPIEDSPSLPVFPSGLSSSTAVSCQTPAPLSAPVPTFTFGSSSASGQNNFLQPANGSFNFQAPLMGNSFSTSNLSSAPVQMPNFLFGASSAMDGKQVFGTSSPVFGQSTGGLIPFGTPGFADQTHSTLGTPLFSTGSGSRPSGARQRLQARRQHTRRK
ncbi:nuclear envelope pore membrane protein POM 121-like [Arapaima gigas]